MAVGIEVQNFLMIAIVLSMFSMLLHFDVHFQLVHREYITCVFFLNWLFETSFTIYYLSNESISFQF